MTHGPIQEQYRKQMNRLAKLIDEFFNGRREPSRKPTVGFILLTPEFGKIEGGKVNYISNGRVPVLTGVICWCLSPENHGSTRTNDLDHPRHHFRKPDRRRDTVQR